MSTPFMSVSLNRTLPLWRRSLLMAGRTFSAISRGTLTRTVSFLDSVLTTRTCSQRSEVFEESEVMLTDWAYSTTGANSKAAARAMEARRAMCCEIEWCESWLMYILLLEDGVG